MCVCVCVCVCGGGVCVCGVRERGEVCSCVGWDGCGSWI